MQKDITR
jgi:DNA primase